ncbi:redoxin domain-containing protein [Alicyclobacillus sp. SO9]|uniref:redoxin domain-containing protein n=1 Tax=Alicyclobacillus sp. SO9 TaxID=2665646 RepID=UPI0018E7186A|nr:redoxin domain-containing protein [Alicyclobacillus sp. SO9]QQE78464.1 redoxin domain-containing protein [Alicyclobacillus sp. SO9]
MKKGFWRSEWVVPIAVLIVGIAVLSVLKANFGQSVKHTTTPNPGGNLTKSTAKHKTTGSNGQSKSKNSVINAGDAMHGRPAPNFTLTNQFGKKVSLSQFKGKTVILSFIDSTCHAICPLTTEDIKTAVHLLGPKAQKNIQIIGVNANPKSTSVAAVKKYSIEHGMLHSWQYLTGSSTQLHKVWKDYYVYSGVVNGQIDHTPALYVIGPKGKEKLLYMVPSQYSSVNAESHVLAKNIAKYLPSSIKTNITPVQYHAPAKGPGNLIQLPSALSTGSAKSVTLNPRKPQLVVFFASWIPHIKEKLTRLNKYASQPGHPQVIAVDVATTEPGLKPLTKLMAQFPKLNFKVGIDKTGKVADAYHIQELTWFALKSSSGKIVWHHSEWIKMTQMSKDVKKALTQSHQ